MIILTKKRQRMIGERLALIFAKIIGSKSAGAIDVETFSSIIVDTVFECGADCAEANIEALDRILLGDSEFIESIISTVR